jgi:hypothetical protein
VATLFPCITDEQAALIARSPLFFIASADPALTSTPGQLGPVNLSPKGATPLHVIAPDRVAYLDYPGSGNETARHATAGGPVTIMICSFEPGDAAIVRLFGHATVMAIDESPLRERLLGERAAELASRPRQAVEIRVETAQTSCGYGVPVMEWVRERRGEDRGRQYK